MANDPKSATGGQFGVRNDQFEVAGPQAHAQWDMSDLLAPTGTYIGVEDNLAVQYGGLTSASIAVINLRILRLDGVIVPLKFMVPANNSRTPALTIFPLLEGFLLSCTVTSAAPLSTTVLAFIEVGLCRNPNTKSDIYRVLVSSLLNSSYPLGWPDQQPRLSLDGMGQYHSQAIGAPAAGADFVFAVPTSSRMRIVSITATLTTAVAVANRLVSLIWDDGVNVLGVAPTGVTLAASGADTFTWYDGADITAPFDGKSTAPLATNMIMWAGSRIRSSTTGIQPADQWSSIFMQVAEWIDPT